MSSVSSVFILFQSTEAIEKCQKVKTEVVEMTAYVVMTDVLLMLLDTQRISQNTVIALQVLSLFS